MSEVAALLDRLLEKHESRALLCLAMEVCSTDKTNGFCGPTIDEATGALICRHGGTRVSCAPIAKGLMNLMKTRGMVPFWPYDKELPEQIAKADLIAARERQERR